MNDDGHDDVNDDTDDELLRALGAQARDERGHSLERALDDWASGKVDARQAAVEAGEAHADLFVPLREETRERIAAQALAQLAAPPPDRAGVSASARPPGPRRSRWPAGLFGGGATLVAAAAAAVWLAWVRPAAPLPGYQFAVEGGDLAERGAGATPPGASPTEAGVRVLSIESALTVALRPLTPVSGPLEARLYVRPPAGPASLSAATAEVSAAGAIRWRGTARQLGGGLTGDLVLHAVVGRPGTLPAPDALSPASTPAPGVAAFQTAIRVLDQPPR